MEGPGRVIVHHPHTGVEQLTGDVLDAASTAVRPSRQSFDHVLLKLQLNAMTLARRT